MDFYNTVAEREEATVDDSVEAQVLTKAAKAEVLHRRSFPEPVSY